MTPNESPTIHCNFELLKVNRCLFRARDCLPTCRSVCNGSRTRTKLVRLLPISTTRERNSPRIDSYTPISVLSHQTHCFSSFFSIIYHHRLFLFFASLDGAPRRSSLCAFRLTGGRCSPPCLLPVSSGFLCPETVDWA